MVISRAQLRLFEKAHGIIGQLILKIIKMEFHSKQNHWWLSKRDQNPTRTPITYVNICRTVQSEILGQYQSFVKLNHGINYDIYNTKYEAVFPLSPDAEHKQNQQIRVNFKVYTKLIIFSDVSRFIDMKRMLQNCTINAQNFTLFTGLLCTIICDTFSEYKEVVRPTKNGIPEPFIYLRKRSFSWTWSRSIIVIGLKFLRPTQKKKLGFYL